MTININKLKKEIIKELNNIDSINTNNIMNILKNISIKYGLNYNFTEPNNKEWLFDFIAYTQKEIIINDNKKQILDEVILCVESEISDYSFDNIINDFQKLILARTKLRIIIFKTSESIEKRRLNDLIKILDHSSVCKNGDKYLLIAYVYNYDSLEITEYKKKNKYIIAFLRHINVLQNLFCKYLNKIFIYMKNDNISNNGND
jgi:hypothetical protein